MERKTQRVGIGLGAFHYPPRAKYSEETRNLIKELMEESKLSMMQRKSIQNVVDRGEPLPPHKPVHNKKTIQPQVMYPSIWKKRSQDMMIASGAYERDQYRRTAPLVDTEKKKRHLAHMMAFGQDMPPTPHGPKILHQGRNQPSIPDEEEVFQELVDGIRERIEFLNDMEALGQGKKYRPIIQQEIAQKLRLIENRPTGLEKELAKLKAERPTPKPYPLGDIDI